MDPERSAFEEVGNSGGSSSLMGDVRNLGVFSHSVDSSSYARESRSFYNLNSSWVLVAELAMTGLLSVLDVARRDRGAGD